MTEWETVKPKWVIANEDMLMKEGLKVQATARFLIVRLGYDILKSEQDILTQRQVSILETKVGRHLARYSDYIVKRGRRIYVIEVKAKQYSPLLLHGGKLLMFNASIFLKRHYVDTLARVLVLVVLYPLGLFGSSRMRSKKVYYALLNANGSPTAEGGVEIALDQDLGSYRWVQVSTFRQWIKATKRDAQALIQMHP